MKVSDAMVTFKIKRWIFCRKCIGTGEIKLDTPLYGGMITVDYCPHCKGIGQLEVPSFSDGIQAAFKRFRLSLIAASSSFSSMSKVIEEMRSNA